MNLLYSAFATTIGLAIVLNLVLKRPNDGPKWASPTIAWSLVGMPYFLVYFFMAFKNYLDLGLIYFFQAITCVGYIWVFRALEYKKKLTPVQIPIGLALFIMAWSLVSYLQGMSIMTVLLPSTLILAGIAFMLSIYFLMRSEEEVMMKSLLGVLFMMICLMKLLYLSTGEKEQSFYIGLYSLDFLLYLITSLLIFFNNYYRQHSQISKKTRLLKEALAYIPAHVVVLDRYGMVVAGNDVFENFCKDLRSETLELARLLPLYEVEEEAKDKVQSLIASFYDHKKLDIHVMKANGEGFYRMAHHPMIEKKDWHQGAILTIWEDESLTVKRGLLSDYEDPYGRLPNKIGMESYFETLIQKRHDRRVGLVGIKVRNYYRTEEDIGMSLADDYMSILAGYILEVDHVSHLGKISPDTFLVFVPYEEDTTLQNVICDLIGNLQTKVTFKKVVIETSISLGIATYPQEGMNFKTLLNTCYRALAKDNGEGFSQVFYSHGPRVGHNKDLKAGIISAISIQKIDLCFQAQFEVATKEFVGFETLLRYQDLPATEVLAIAEEAGLIENLNRIIFEDVIRYGSKWQTDYKKPFRMSINVSKGQVLSSDFVFDLNQTLYHFQFPSKNLVLEIHEQLVLDHEKEIALAVKNLKVIGVKIAIDGVTSRYLANDVFRSLPHDFIKLDKTMTDLITIDSLENELVLSIVSLARKQKVKTMAVGIERAEQLSHLLGSSCHYFQGHLMNKPFDRNQVVGFLRREQNKVQV